MFSLSYMIWNEGQSPKGYSKWVVLRCLSYRIGVKSCIPIQTNLTEFVSRLLYSLAVILTQLNTPGIIGILTGTFTKGIIEKPSFKLTVQYTAVSTTFSLQNILYDASQMCELYLISR